MAKQKTQSTSIAAEPAAEYVRAAHKAESTAWRFKRLSRKVLMQLARKPMPMARFREKVEANPFAEAAYAELLSVTVSGMRARMRKNVPLEPAQAERVLLYEQTMARGLEVFGDQQKFERWLNLRIKALENQRPADLMTTSTGMQLVADELETIAHGVFA